MQKTAISWSDYSSNPIRATRVRDGRRGWACTKVSPGCAHCYSEALNQRLGTGLPYEEASAALVEWVMVAHELDAILRWKQPGRVFLGDMTDLFHAQVPDAWLDQIFAVMALCPQLTFQLLTKRADRLCAYMHDRDWSDAANLVTDRGLRRLDGPLYLTGEIVPPLPNVHLGVSVENQRLANERIPLLMETPAAVRFLSIEPLLGFIDLTEAMYGLMPRGMNCFGFTNGLGYEAFIQWGIIGGESGPHRREMDMKAFTNLVEQFLEARVPVWVKQDSALKPGQQGRIPDHLWIQEFPGREVANVG